MQRNTAMYNQSHNEFVLVPHVVLELFDEPARQYIELLQFQRV